VCLCSVAITGCNNNSSNTSSNSIQPSPPSSLSGIDFNNLDSSVRLEDDFYSFVNGKWLKNTEIQADKASWSAGAELAQNSINQLHGIISSLIIQNNIANNSNEQKIAYLYNSYMDTSKIDSLGIGPILPELASVDAITDISQIPDIIARLNRIGVSAPYDTIIDLDQKDSSKVVVYIQQNGLGLPDRDYYLNTLDKNLLDVKTKYQQYIVDMLTLASKDIPQIDASQDAINIVNLETALAQIQWTNVENRDANKTYNKLSSNALNQLMPDYNWDLYLLKTRLNDKITYLIVRQPSYLQGLNEIIKQTPLSTWKSYFRWKIINNFAPLLSKEYVDKNFAFYGTTLGGNKENTPRWRRALAFVESSIGFGLGKLYVNQYFPEQNKAKVEAIVNNLKTEFNQSIDGLDWMGENTKKEAKKKLVTMISKIGYPDKWLDYSKLTVKPDDLVGNMVNSTLFESDRNINKLGKPVDKTEWQLTPQTVNAYYNPMGNEVVFPAVMLQPPYFDVNASLAANYGAIGAVIGHELSHAFDDQGSQFDENGNLNNWWTDEDKKRFQEKTAQLVRQYNAYSPLPGYYVNGELTLGENIADNSGFAIAFKAYHLALNGVTPPMINNFSGDQLFYISFAQMWRYKARDPQIIQSLKTNVHSPAIFRTNGVISNQGDFYNLFHVEPGDKMYIAPTERVKLW